MKNQILKLACAGQAVVEYMMVFAVMATIAVIMVKTLGGFMGNTTGSLGFALTQQLTVGVCPDACYYGKYVNW